MKQLAEVVRRSGYLPFYLAFGDANLKMGEWMEGVGTLQTSARMLANLFLLQEEVSADALRNLIGEDLDALLEAKVLKTTESGIRSNDFFLLSVRSWLLLCQINADPWAYFGEDSLALAIYQTPCPGGNSLDLCAGPGIQSFVAAAQSSHVTAVEIKPETAAIGRLNCQLNGLDASRIQYHCASAVDFADTLSEETQYDRVLFNPPLVPVPEGMDYAFVGHGGRDGLDISCAIIRTYAPRLTPSGRIEFVGMGLGSGEHDFKARLRQVAEEENLSGYIQIVSQHQAEESSILFESYAVSVAQGNGWSLDEARSRIARNFQEQQCDHFCLFFSSLGLAGAEAPAVHVTDLSFHYYGNWFV